MLQSVTEDDHTGHKEDDACHPDSQEGVVALELKKVGGSKPKALHMYKRHTVQAGMAVVNAAGASVQWPSTV